MSKYKGFLCRLLEDSKMRKRRRRRRGKRRKRRRKRKMTMKKRRKINRYLSLFRVDLKFSNNNQ